MNFVQNSKVMGERSDEQWRRDAFGQVDAWLKALEFAINQLKHDTENCRKSQCDLTAPDGLEISLQSWPITAFKR
jgi:hypothetical protein